MKVVQSILAFILPYIVIFICWLCSGLAFDYREVVNSLEFYCCAVVYWIFVFPLITGKDKK